LTLGTDLSKGEPPEMTIAVNDFIEMLTLMSEFGADLKWEKASC